MGIWTGALGDTFACLSYLDELEGDTQLIFSPQAGAVSELFNLLKIKNKVVDTSRIYHAKCDVEARFGRLKGEDYSISKIFPKIEKKELSYRGFFNRWHKPVNFSLPFGSNRYAIFCPKSIHKAAGRDLTPDEIAWCINNSEFPLVLLHKGRWSFPKCSKLMDLSNKTNLEDAISLCYWANRYYGCDSCWSILMCQTEQKCHIKSVNPHYYRWINCYQSGLRPNVTTSAWLGKAAIANMGILKSKMKIIKVKP